MVGLEQLHLTTTTPYTQKQQGELGRGREEEIEARGFCYHC